MIFFDLPMNLIIFIVFAVDFIVTLLTKVGHRVSYAENIPNKNVKGTGPLHNTPSRICGVVVREPKNNLLAYRSRVKSSRSFLDTLIYAHHVRCTTKRLGSQVQILLEVWSHAHV